MASGIGGGGFGMSGRTFDAFVSSQRSHNEPDWATKIQEKYWRARQKFLAKIEKNEDSCIVLSDAKLDAKLEIYRSIDKSCARLTNILENYQNNLFVLANEENALGILLKECGKHDKTKAGKIMSMVARSLTQSSHQRIRLYTPLLRLFQEMETFHTRAVEDTAGTVDKLENKRTQYRASLLWMKDISEKLNPDVFEQLDKFRRVQSKVKSDKREFDAMQMDVVQKIDLLMASRCNLMNQILASYQAVLLETFERNHNNFKSVSELISNEDIYEYEFKALKQLNPLKISEEDCSKEHTPPNNEEDVVEQNLLGDIETETAPGAAGDSQNVGSSNLIDIQEDKSGDLKDIFGRNSPDNSKDNPPRAGGSINIADILKMDLTGDLMKGDNLCDLMDDAPKGDDTSKLVDANLEEVNSNNLMGSLQGDEQQSNKDQAKEPEDMFDLLESLFDNNQKNTDPSKLAA
jgi:hypothetical protein